MFSGAPPGLRSAIVGASAADRISGGRGNDRLFGLAGNDVLTGGLASTASTAAPVVTSRMHRSVRAWRGTARSCAAPPVAALASAPVPTRASAADRTGRQVLRLHAARPRHLPVDERGCALDRRAPHPGDRRPHGRIALDVDPLVPGRGHRSPGGSLVLVHALRRAGELLHDRDRHPDDVHDLRADSAPQAMRPAPSRSPALRSPTRVSATPARRTRCRGPRRSSPGGRSVEARLERTQGVA
jgi:hypothetical protein